MPFWFFGGSISLTDGRLEFDVFVENELDIDANGRSGREVGWCEDGVDRKVYIIFSPNAAACFQLI